MTGISMRILAVDPGEARLGIAISDPSGILARPLTILKHTSRLVDAAAIAGLAAEHGAGRIIVGQALDEQGQPSYQGRRAAKLAGAIRTQTGLAVELWDESLSTQDAVAARAAAGAGRRSRKEPVDDLAAAVILQSYLDFHNRSGQTPGQETG
jgi:putative Holliday junction resolvase